MLSHNHLTVYNLLAWKLIRHLGNRVCSAWKCSFFLVQLFSLASGGLALRMIPTGRIELDFVDPYLIPTNNEFCSIDHWGRVDRSTSGRSRRRVSPRQVV